MVLGLAEPFESKEALTTLSVLKAYYQDSSHWRNSHKIHRQLLNFFKMLKCSLFIYQYIPLIFKIAFLRIYILWLLF